VSDLSSLPFDPTQPSQLFVEPVRPSLSLAPITEGLTAPMGESRLQAAPEKAEPPAPYSWPTPPYAAYPQPQPQTRPLLCDVIGLNGKVTSGRLIFFVPEQGIVHLQMPPARTTVALRFSQFRSIRVLEPIKPAIARRGDDQPDLSDHRPRSPYTLLLADGTELQGETIGHLETGFGLFLFPPLDDLGHVTRLFVPRDNYRRFDFGSRLGELLIEEGATTPAKLEEAVTEQIRLRELKLGDILISHKVVTPEQLNSALDQQSRMPMVRIGDALLQLGLISQTQIDEALRQQAEHRSTPLGELLIRMGAISEADLQVALARKMGFPLVDVDEFPIDVEAVRKVPLVVAERLRCVPLTIRHGRLVVALEDAARRRPAIEEIEFVSQLKAVPVLAQSRHLDRSLRAAYQKAGVSDAPAGTDFAPAMAFDPSLGNDVGQLVQSLEKEQGGDDPGGDDKPIEQSDNSLVKLVNSLVLTGYREGVSDIHIECFPGKEKIKVRFRKDGLLHTHLTLPHTYRSAIVARIKIMCDLDISERRKPQDGKISFNKFVQGQNIELRVATIPTHSGCEDVVMRILASAKPIPVDDLGLAPWNLKHLKQAMERPYGMVLCVGPTGSGKTTTLHSALSYINVPERKIWTAEDPIEITQPGLRQVQVNAKIDWTFAKALRSFLRADPDVVMVGEIRDRETAQMSVEASLTGHLVLSTLHTNSAPETVTRLLDMGMDPFNFADSLLGVLAQRLVRRLCKHCRSSRPATDEEVEVLLDDYLFVCPKDDSQFDRAALRTAWLGRFGQNGRLMHFHSPGCEHCDDTGFRGRAGLHELMVVTRELRHLIQTGARAEVLQQQALKEGMRTLRQDGIDKVLQGICTIEEVRATSNV
jgi:type II secretory ATPase GspE/PulE/Tfp pilus assembly ATPase PilB-like protein